MTVGHMRWLIYKAKSFGWKRKRMNGYTVYYCNVCGYSRNSIWHYIEFTNEAYIPVGIYPKHPMGPFARYKVYLGHYDRLYRKMRIHIKKYHPFEYSVTKGQRYNPKVKQ